MEAHEYAITIAEAIDMYDCLASIQVQNIFLSVTEGYEFDAVSNKYRFLNRVFEPNKRWPKQAGPKHVLVSHTEKCLVTLKDFTQEIKHSMELQAKIAVFVAAQVLVTNKLEWLVKEKVLWALEQFEKERRLDLDETLPMRSNDEDSAE